MLLCVAAALLIDGPACPLPSEGSGSSDVPFAAKPSRWKKVTGLASFKKLAKATAQTEEVAASSSGSQNARTADDDESSGVAETETETETEAEAEADGGFGMEFLGEMPEMPWDEAGSAAGTSIIG